jgi:phosphoesterase RecJ-like protein
VPAKLPVNADNVLNYINGSPMTMKDKMSVIVKAFMDAQTIALTTHIRPDGDGIASELALYLVLRAQGKNVYIVNQDKTPDMYRWLPAADSIIELDGEMGRGLPNHFDLSVLLDCSSESRIGGAIEIIKRGSKIISIDHHESNNCLRDDCYIDTTASSIGEILFDLISELHVKLNSEIARCLYTSILWDTGSFAYSNTSAKVFSIVSKLLEFGVEPAFIYNLVFNNKSLAHFRLLGRALELLKVDSSGKIVSLLLPLAVYRNMGAREEDNEGIIEVIKGLKNIELVIFIRQIDPYKIKGSLRSVDRVNCNYLAGLFGGGGHLKASGFTVKGDIQKDGLEIIERIIEEVIRKGWI